MFTQAEIKAYLLTQGLTVKTIKAHQVGDDDTAIKTYDPKVIYYGHTQGLIEDPALPGNVNLYTIVGQSFAGDEKNPGQSSGLKTLDVFFRYLEVNNATTVFNGYKITLL